MTTIDFQSKQYFDWLCTHIWIPPGDKTYDGLLKLLWEKEFIWVIGNDDNRIQDGRDLRDYYLNMLDPTDRKSHDLTHVDAVSTLEVLIGVASRVAFLVDENPRTWAWKLIENLRLDRFPDPLDRRKIDRVNDMLDILIWRTYRSDGLGGFFPLKHPKRNQKDVEIWYQMCDYIEEIMDPHDI